MVTAFFRCSCAIISIVSLTVVSAAPRSVSSSTRSAAAARSAASFSARSCHTASSSSSALRPHNAFGGTPALLRFCHALSILKYLKKFP
uniref:Secreted protein n=1 Tax=Setaria viridis TaxID=4556 RepID=A0A4U6VLI1_SETVI|nr:hypothetical protein SEVIR_2G044366v2 [Setaria viridis]